MAGIFQRRGKSPLDVNGGLDDVLDDTALCMPWTGAVVSQNAMFC
jgi:hypothetical protein